MPEWSNGHEIQVKEFAKLRTMWLSAYAGSNEAFLERKPSGKELPKALFPAELIFYKLNLLGKDYLKISSNILFHIH